MPRGTTADPAATVAPRAGAGGDRRWDADIRTLAAQLPGGQLGELWAVESRIDQADAATLEVGPDARLLRDLGGHLVDQVLWLLGPARTIHAELDHVEPAGGRTDCRFVVSLTHDSGVRSRVSASKINYIEDRELRAYGSTGSYVARGTDVQAHAVFAGRRPVDEGSEWGYDAPEHWGTLNTATGSTTVPSEQGAYQDYYTRRGPTPRRRRLPGARRAGRAHPRGARRRTGQRRREPRGRPAAELTGAPGSRTRVPQKGVTRPTTVPMVGVPGRAGRHAGRW